MLVFLHHLWCRFYWSLRLHPWCWSHSILLAPHTPYALSCQKGRGPGPKNLDVPNVKIYLYICSVVVCPWDFIFTGAMVHNVWSNFMVYRTIYEIKCLVRNVGLSTLVIEAAVLGNRELIRLSERQQLCARMPKKVERVCHSKLAGIMLLYFVTQERSCWYPSPVLYPHSTSSSVDFQCHG